MLIIKLIIICQEVSTKINTPQEHTSGKDFTSKWIIISSNRYGANNLQFGLYYDKVFKKEYLPTRIRYNQFFFYAGLIYFVYTLHTRNWMFVSEE